MPRALPLLSRSIYLRLLIPLVVASVRSSGDAGNDEESSSVLVNKKRSASVLGEA